MFFHLLTTVVLAAHFAYLGYVVVGGFLAWRLLQVVVGLLVVASWVGAYLRWRSRRDTATKSGDRLERAATV